jgi:hypothetical protein
MGESPAVTACSLTRNVLRGFGLILAGGEDHGYFASDAGDAGSNPAAGIVPRSSVA